MKIAFRVDASPEIGTGHLSRCLNLAHALHAKGAEIRLIIRPHPRQPTAWIEALPFVVSWLAPLSEHSDDFYIGDIPHGHWLRTTPDVDAQETSEILARDFVDWLVVDHYAIDIEWERRVRASCGRIMVIDDLADRSHDCDLLVDQNALPSLGRDYSGLVPPSCRRLLGVDYALISADYAQARVATAPRTPPIRRVLIFFGGADAHDLTGMTLDAIQELGARDVQFDVVIGDAHPRREQVIAAARDVPTVVLHSRLPSLARLISSADLGLGAGGVSMWERCCLGLPSLVVTVAENQKPGTKAAEEAGLVTWLGHHDSISTQTITKSLAVALANKDLTAISRRCFAAVDARGTERLGAALLGLSDAWELRDATPEDEARLLAWANDPQGRANAIVPGLISASDHHGWFAGRLAAPNACRIYIANTADGLPLGQVRFDREAELWKISYSLDAAVRGQRLSGPILRRAIERLNSVFGRAEFLAYVKTANVPSVRVFEKLAFRKVHEADGLATYQL